MNKIPQFFLQHVLESIDWIEKDVVNLTFEQFAENVPIQDAVIRRLEIISEAMKNLPDEVKNVHPEIPWVKIAGTRNKLIHEYFGVDLDLVWSVVKDYLPPLKGQIQILIEELGRKKE